MYTIDPDFILFKTECERWRVILGQISWHVVYTHMNNDPSKAEYCTELHSRTVTINFPTEINDCVYSDETIKLMAFHEIVESMLLAKLSTMINIKKYEDEEIWNAIHEVVRILERTLYPKYKNYNQEVE